MEECRSDYGKVALVVIGTYPIIQIHVIFFFRYLFKMIMINGCVLL